MIACRYYGPIFETYKPMVSQVCLERTLLIIAASAVASYHIPFFQLEILRPNSMMAP